MLFFELDAPLIAAAKVTAKYSKGWTLEASVLPVVNAKVQSNYGIISPLTEEALATGVTMAVHTSLPLAAKITVKKGELELVLKTPQQALGHGAVEAFHGFVLPYTARKNMKVVAPINKAVNLKAIVTGNPLKKVRN